MPNLDLPVVEVSREIGDGLTIRELLYSPELHLLQEDTAENSMLGLARVMLPSVQRQWLHERLAGPLSDLRVERVEVLVPPSPMTAWTSPLRLSYFSACWQTESGHIQAIIPDLELDLIEPTWEAISAQLPKAIVAALKRKQLLPNFVDLQQTQRTLALTLTRHTLSLALPSPLEQIRLEKAQESDGQPSVLRQVTTALSELMTRAPRCYGLAEERKRLLDLLRQTPPRSILLVGPSGVGKSILFQALMAERKGLGLKSLQAFFTSGARLVAGMSGFGQWQERCLRLVKEAPAHSHVLHLGHLFELMESGKSSASQESIASFLLNFVARGEIRVVLEATPEALSVIERQLPRALEVLEVVRVEEPSPEQTRLILRRAVGDMQEPLPEVSDLVLERLERLHTRFATTSCRPGRPLRFLHDLITDARVELAPGYFESPPLLEEQVLKAFSRETGLPRWVIDPTIPFDAEGHRQWLSQRVVGQDEAVGAVVEVLTTLKAGLQRPSRPLATFLCIGPTGVGKTQLARSLAELLFQDPDRMFRFDMSEYAHPFAADRLVGGIQGKEGLLTSRVREQPFCVVLLDELEKADGSVFDLLLQMLGEGRLTDGAGRLADFSNTLVLMTSNLGVASYRPTQTGFSGAGRQSGNTAATQASVTQVSATLAAATQAQEQAARARTAEHFTREVEKFIRPELFNRLDRVLTFQPLSKQTLRQIVGRELSLLHQRTGLKQRPLTLEIAPTVQDWLAEHGYDDRYGARPLKRLIEQRLLYPLAVQINQYSLQVPLRVTVRVEAGKLEVEAVGRAGSAITPPQNVLLDPSADRGGSLERLLGGVQLLRTDVQKLVQSGSSLDRVNTLARLRHEFEWLRHRMANLAPEQTKSPGSNLLPLEPRSAADRLYARLAHQQQRLEQQIDRLEALEKDVADFSARVLRQEAELLMAMLQEQAPQQTFLEASELNRQFTDLQMSLYAHMYPNGDNVTLVLLCEEENVRSQWAGRYESQLSALGLKVDLRRLVILASPPPKGKVRPPVAKGACQRLFTKEDAPFVIGTDRQVCRAEKLLEPGTIGAVLEATGPNAQLMVANEQGRHVLQPLDKNNERQSFVLLLVPPNPPDWQLPEGVARRGALERFPEVRRYRTIQSGVEVTGKGIERTVEGHNQALLVALTEHSIRELRQTLFEK